MVATAFVVGDHAGSAGSAGETSPSPPSSPPLRIVSTEEFCDAFDLLVRAQQVQLTSASTDSVTALKDAATRVADATAGAAVPEAVRAGVAYVVDAFLALPDDATAQDVVDSDDAATLRDDAHADALAAYLGDSCGGNVMSDAK